MSCNREVFTHTQNQNSVKITVEKVEEVTICIKANNQMSSYEGVC